MNLNPLIYVVVAEKGDDQFILCQETKDGVQKFSFKPWEPGLNASDVFISWVDDLEKVFQFIRNLGNEFLKVEFDIPGELKDTMTILEAELKNNKIYIL